MEMRNSVKVELWRVSQGPAVHFFFKSTGPVLGTGAYVESEVDWRGEAGDSSVDEVLTMHV